VAERRPTWTVSSPSSFATSVGMRNDMTVMLRWLNKWDVVTARRTQRSLWLLSEAALRIVRLPSPNFGRYAFPEMTLFSSSTTDSSSMLE
jgi:hypothetical protein